MEDPLIQGEDEESTDDVASAQGAAPQLPEVQARGYASRKLWYAVATSTGIALGGIFFAYCEGFRAAYQTMIGGLLSAFALYAGANVTNRHLVSKHVAQLHAINQSAHHDDDQAPPRVEPLPPG